MEHLTLIAGMKSTLTLENLGDTMRTTFVQAGKLGKRATLKLVKVTTLNTRQPFLPTS